MIRPRRPRAGRPGRRPLGIGVEAMEARQLLATFTVTSLLDDGPGTLREAIERANASPEADEIAFAPGVSGTIALRGALPPLAGAVSIEGPGADRLEVVPGPEAGPIRLVAVEPGAPVRIAGLTLAGGRPEGPGGGIFNAGTLAIDGVVLRDNRADPIVFQAPTGQGTRVIPFDGGAISNASPGVLTIVNSALVGNRASRSGGAIATQGAVTVVNSTIAGNAADLFGGGLLIEEFPDGSLTLVSSTLSGNLAAAGGAINGSGPISATSTLFDDPVLGAPRLTSGGFNLFRAGPDVPLEPTDLVGVDPLLAPIGSHGGPTPTLALLPGSPAIDAGGIVLGVSSDQRGVPRPSADGRPDVGAFESLGFAMTIASGDGQGAPVGSPFAEPLVVSVSSPSGAPVAGGVVRFEAERTGPSAEVAASAPIGPDGIASTSAVANALAGSYDVIASAAGADPVQFTLSNRIGILDVVDVVRLGFHARPTRIVLTFDRPLDPAQAARVANYRLFGPGLDAAPGSRFDRPLRLRSARYDPGTTSVTLESAEPLRLLGGRRYRVVVDDAVRPGGGPGVGATATVGAEDFRPTPELSRALLRVQRLQRHRPGTGRLR